MSPPKLSERAKALADAFEQAELDGLLAPTKRTDVGPVKVRLESCATVTLGVARWFSELGAGSVPESAAALKRL
ncbi:hypothetical protein [Streptomyces canus]|uniref:hypothetical protein n=1 Tax=Streptomyces TaxID=1883 RepID=UPI0036ED9787